MLGDPDTSVVVVDSWRGPALPDLRTRSPWASRIVIHWAIAETGKSDAEIAAEIGEALISPAVVARWRDGTCVPPFDVGVRIVAMAGRRGLPILAAMCATIAQAPPS